MGRPIKDPKGKIETTVTQILKKLGVLRDMAENGYISLDDIEQISKAIDDRSVKIVEAIKFHEDKKERTPFKL